jgi:hypothetical protein
MSDKADESKAEVLQTVNHSLADLGDGVRELATAMKDGAPEAWRIMVRQQELNALTVIGTLLSILIIGLFIYLFIGRKITGWKTEIVKLRKNKLNKRQGEKKNIEKQITENKLFIKGWGIGRILGGIALVFFVVVIANDKDVVERLINPEYYAAKDLVQMIGKARCP